MNYCKARGFSHLGATVSVFLLFMAVMLTLLLIILPATWNQLIQFLSEVPRMASKGQELLLLLPERYPELVSVEQVKEWTKQIGDEVASLGQFAVSFSLSGITGLMAVLIYCVLVPILVFFLLKDSSQILMWVTSFLPTKRLNKVDLPTFGAPTIATSKPLRMRSLTCVPEISRSRSAITPEHFSLNA